MHRREEIIALKETGLTDEQIGVKLGISKQRVHQIRHGYRKIARPRRPASSLLTISEVGMRLNVHTNTIRRWADSGVLKAYRIGPRRDRHFSEGDLREFLEKSMLPKYEGGGNQNGDENAATSKAKV